MGIFDNFSFNPKPLTKEPAEAFLGSFSDFTKQFKNLEKNEETGFGKINERQFQELWGFYPNEELKNLYEQLNSLGFPKFNNWESAAIKTDILNSKENIVEEVLLKAQIEFPTDHHIEWFTGTVSLDPIVNGPNQWDGKNYSYLYPIVESEFLEKANPHIYLHTHSNPDGWGTNVEIMAKDVSTFLFIIMSIHARREKKIKNNDFGICMNKVKDKAKLPYYFFNSFQYNNQYISTYNFRYNTGNNRGSAITIDYFNRARWIIELLKGNHNNSFWSIRNSFYPKYLNPALSNEIHEANLKHLPNHVPDALYYLFRCFFRNETGQLKEYISVCKNSNSRIIKDAAILVEQFNDGKEFFGEIDNIQRLKQDFNNGMSW